MNDRIHKKGDIANDRYKVIEYIGEGGMQQVYNTWDLRLERNVALKVPKNITAKRRFKRSAVLSAKVNHPNVAKTLDYFEIGNTPYLIEEYINGCDLGTILVNDVYFLDPYMAAHLLHHLAKGLAASHHVGVIHRDLKPSNIMITGSLNFAQIKITDFGIAKMAQEEIAEAAEGGESSITGSKTMVGALPYMAPEMITNPREIETPADIWALGALLYEVISGKKPFGAGLTAIPKIIDANVPEIPEHININNQYKRIGNQLYDIIKHCLIKNPTERPTTNDLVKQCEQLCYPYLERHRGVVKKIFHDSWGFIIDESGEDIFFHLDSICGTCPQPGETVCFTKFEAIPRYRAHPVIKTKS